VTPTTNVTTPVENVTTPIENVTTPVENVTTPVENVTTPEETVTWVTVTETTPPVILSNQTGDFGAVPQLPGDIPPEVFVTETLPASVRTLPVEPVGDGSVAVERLTNIPILVIQTTPPVDPPGGPPLVPPEGT